MAPEQVKNLLLLAQQGYSSAIVALLNRQFKAKGITTTVSIDGNCLQIVLESLSVPNRQSLVALIRQGMTRLNPERVQWVHVCGKRFIDELPAWEYEFPLPLRNESTPLYLRESELFQQDEEGDLVNDQARSDIPFSQGPAPRDDFNLADDKITLPKDVFWNVLGHVILQHQ
jgi:hypothetical protein